MTVATKLSYAQALTEALRMEMHRDSTLVCLVGDATSASVVTRDIAAAFGPDRMIRLDPHALPVPVAAGMASRGVRVVCEAPAALLGPGALAPLAELDGAPTVVVRVPDGGPTLASSTPAPIAGRLFDTGGIAILAPGTPADAKGMLASAVRGGGATCLLEDEALYQVVGDVPEGRHLVAAAAASVEAWGARASVFAYGLGADVVRRSVSTAGLEIELVDLRSLRPMDGEAIVASVGRTGKAAVVEPPGSTRIAAEVGALLVTSAFEYLDGPLARLELPEWAGVKDRRDEAAALIAAGIDDLAGY